MLTNIKENENKVFVNPIQETPQRTSIYSISRCENQVIGFEFIKLKSENNTNCLNNVLINLCVPIEVLSPIEIESAEFRATDDPCFKEWVTIKDKEPELEIQRDSSNLVTGILVRFGSETCCYSTQMAYKLIGKDKNNSIFSLSQGLLIFK